MWKIRIASLLSILIFIVCVGMPAAWAKQEAPPSWYGAPPEEPQEGEDGSEESEELGPGMTVRPDPFTFTSLEFYSSFGFGMQYESMRVKRLDENGAVAVDDNGSEVTDIWHKTSLLLGGQYAVLPSELQLDAFLTLGITQKHAGSNFIVEGWGLGVDYIPYNDPNLRLLVGLDLSMGTVSWTDMGADYLRVAPKISLGYALVGLHIQPYLALPITTGLTRSGKSYFGGFDGRAEAWGLLALDYGLNLSYALSDMFFLSVEPAGTVWLMPTTKHFFYVTPGVNWFWENFSAQVGARIAVLTPMPGQARYDLILSAAYRF